MKILFNSDILEEKNKKEFLHTLIKSNGIISDMNENDKDMIFEILNKDCEKFVSGIPEEKSKRIFNLILSNITITTYEDLLDKYTKYLKENIVTINVLYSKYGIDIKEFIDRLEPYCESSIEIEERLNSPMDLVFEKDNLSIYGDDDFICAILNDKLLFCHDYIGEEYSEYHLFNYDNLNLINIIFGNSENYDDVKCSYLLNTKTGRIYEGDMIWK